MAERARLSQISPDPARWPTPAEVVAKIRVSFDAEAEAIVDDMLAAVQQLYYAAQSNSFLYWNGHVWEMIPMERMDEVREGV